MSIIAVGSVLMTVLKAILPSAADITKVVLGNQAGQANNNAEADKAAQDAYAKEFSYPLGEHRTRFDTFMDGVNRLPRPGLVIIVFSMIAWPMFDPESAARAFKSLQLVPEMLWQLAILIVAFYFSSRALERIKLNPYRAQALARSAPAISSSRREPEEEAAATSVPKTESLDAASVFGLVSHHDELLALAGFGPGQLSTRGYSGSLPASRARGWKNPICLRYVVED